MACFAGGDASAAGTAAAPSPHARTAAFAPSFCSYIRSLVAAYGVAPLLPATVYELDEAAAQLPQPPQHLFTPDGAIVRFDPGCSGSQGGVVVCKVRSGMGGVAMLRSCGLLVAALFITTVLRYGLLPVVIGPFDE